MIFNERILQLRHERHLKQKEVAEPCKMTVRSYQRLEGEGARPHYEALLNLADFFDVSVDYLMGRTEKREVNR